MKRILLPFFLLVLSMNLNAQMTIENFAYGATSGTSADTLTNPAIGGGVWRRHSGTTGPVAYKGTSLSYTGYSSSGVGGSAGFTFATGFAEDVNRVTTTFNSGSVYISYLLSISNAGGTGSSDAYFFHLLDTSFMTAFRGRQFIRNGSVANTFNIGLGKSATSTPAYSSVDYPLNTPILVVMKYTFDPSALDSVRCYIFTSGVPASEPATAQVIATDVSATDLARINAVAIRQHPTGSTMIGTIDGIRVSNSWANSALPVNLTSFEGQITEHQTTLLTWTTASEINNKGFEIESSQDGINFETIGFAEGVGNSKTIQKYQFEYNSNTNAYYRLNQIDYDGESTYSQVITVKNQENETKLSPNPFNDFIEITTNSPIQRAEIIDITGKIVMSENLESNTVKLNAKELLNGIYFVKLYQGDAVITKRIIKTN